MLARFCYPAGSAALVETSCKLPCQHPSCWASQRRQEKGVPHKLPPIASNRSASDDQTDLPVQSILNLLSEYGESNADSLLESPRVGYSHHHYTRPFGPRHPVPSPSIGCQRKILRSRETTRQPTGGKVSNAHLHVVEVKDSIEKAKFSSGWNELFVRNQLYVWLPNTKKMPGDLTSRSPGGKNPHHALMKDVTECMVPEEIGHKRQNNILFADWPTLKKKHACDRRQTQLSIREKVDTPFSGISNSQSYCPLKEQLNHDLHGKPPGSQPSDANKKLNAGSVKLLSEHQENIHDQVLHRKPAVALHESQHLDDSILPNKVVSRQKSRNVLPGGYKQRELTMSSHQTSDCYSKVTSISLELPHFLMHSQRPKPFSYGKQEFDFSLGPVPVSLSRYQSRFHEDYSDRVPRVGSSMSATLLIQQKSSNSDADEFVLYSESSPMDMQVTFHKAAAAFPTQELLPIQNLPDSHIVPELAADTRCDLQWTTARRQTETEQAADREDSIQGDDEVTAESPAPPPPSPEPKDML